MQSAIGVNSVRATLEKSLLRAQKRFNLSNPSSAAKEIRLQEKIENRKLQKKLKQIARDHRLLCGSELSDDQIAADWRDLLVNPVELEFEPAQDSYADFIADFQAQFNKFCDTTDDSEETIGTISALPPNSIASINLNKKKNSIKGESKKLKKLRKILKKTKRLATLDLEDEDSLSLNTTPASKSKLEVLQEKRINIRRIQKAIKKEAKRLREEAKQSEKVDLKKVSTNLVEKKVRKQTMKDMTVSDVGVTASQGSSTHDCSSKSNIITKTLIPNGITKKVLEPTLPKPKFTIFRREDVQLGWTQKYPPGCGFINAGNSCYMNATLQAIFHIPSFVNWLLSDKAHRRQCQSSQKFQQCMVCALRNTLEESLDGRPCLRPSQIHSKLRLISQNFVFGRQEDAHEFLRHLLESLEVAYLRACDCTNYDIRSKETTPLGQIFGGYLRTEVTCFKCHHVSTTFQPLAELQLDIRHATSVAEAVGYHFRREKVDNNDYKCEGCRSIAPVIKQFSLELPPNVLCLQLKRFTLFGGKLSRAIQCNRELDLTRFLHSSQASLYPKNLKYRMVSLITHIGSSPNGGHYTAIAETSTGTLYQFDDTYVRSIPAQTTDSVSSDAYVIIYEMVDSSKDTTKVGVPSVSPTAQIRIHTPSVTLNGFSSQKFPKPSTVTSASVPSTHTMNESPKPFKFVFNTQAKVLNPFAVKNTNLDKTSSPPVKVLPFTMPKILHVNSPATNGNKAQVPADTKGKGGERTPISFSLKTNGLETRPKISAARFGPIPSQPQRPLESHLERKESQSPKPINGTNNVQTKSASTNPTSLVPYDDDDSSNGTPNRVNRERSSTPKTSVEIPKQNFDTNLVTTPIRSWNETGSILSKAIESNRKRELETARPDSYNEELDVGRTKKQKLDSSQQPKRDSSINKFQSYEDQRRLVNERTKALMSPAKPSVSSGSGFGKDSYSHHQSYSNNGENNSRLPNQYHNQNPNRQGVKYQGHHSQYRGHSFSGNDGYEGYGGFRRHNSAPSFHNRFNDNRNHRGGGMRGGPWRHPGKNHYKSKYSYNNNNYYR